MAGFFDIKARKEAAAAAAANGTSNGKAAPAKDSTKLQPWVEK